MDSVKLTISPSFGPRQCNSGAISKPFQGLKILCSLSIEYAQLHNINTRSVRPFNVKNCLSVSIASAYVDEPMVQLE